MLKVRPYLIAGIFFGLGLIVAFTTTSATAQSSSTPRQASSNIATGRYQIAIGSPTSPFLAVFMLDTETGRVWRRAPVEGLAGEPDVWLIEERFDTPAAFAAWAAKMPKAPPKAEK